MVSSSWFPCANQAVVVFAGALGVRDGSGVGRLPPVFKALRGS